jgi:hypothetical protein
MMLALTQYKRRKVAIVPPYPSVGAVVKWHLRHLFESCIYCLDRRGVKAMVRSKKKGIVGIKIRLAKELIAQLELAAKKRGISFNAEAAMRLGKSVAEDDELGGEAGRDMLYRFAIAFVMAGNQQAGHREISRWIKESEAYNAAMFGLIAEMMIDQPTVSFETCSLQIEALKGRIKTRLLNKENRL